MIQKKLNKIASMFAIKNYLTMIKISLSKEIMMILFLKIKITLENTYKNFMDIETKRIYEVNQQKNIN